MSYNGSGTFQRTFDCSTDRDNGIKILADKFDTELDGFATGLTNVICRDGQSTTTARIPFAVGLSFNLGSAGTPSISPTGDTNTGIYSSASDKISFSCNGSLVGEFTTTGLSITGNISQTGSALFGDGTISAPGFAFTSDTNTGAYRIGADHWALVANGAAVIDISTSGISITGTLASSSDFAIATNKFNVTASSGNTAIAGTLTVGGTSSPVSNDGAALGSTSLMWSDLFLASGGVINWNNGDVTITHSTNLLAYAGASSGYTFDNLLTVGHTANLTIGGLASNVEVLGTTEATASLAVGLFDATGTDAPKFNFYRSLNASIGSATVVASGNQLGKITWYGAQQTGTFATQNPAVQIRAEVDGAVSSGASGDMPGRIVFSTTADGSGTLTDQLILDSAGILKPNTNDGVPLGTGSLSFSDLFLASGGVVNFNNGDVTITHSANVLAFAGAATKYTFDALVAPTTSDGAALGSTSLMWSDVFLASGAVVNFNNGDVTITHSADTLAFAGAATAYTFDNVVDIQGAVKLSGTITPTTLSGDQNDYTPTGNATASVWRLASSSSANRTITGIAGGAGGRELFIQNIGAFGNGAIIIASQNTSSTAANRLAAPVDLVIAPGEGRTLIYDGTASRWNVPNNVSASGCWASFKNLSIANGAGTPSGIMDVTADELILEDTDGNTKRLRSVSQSPSMGASGAGGLDTGAEASSTWYFIWIIYNAITGTVSSLFSTSATAPTMPSGSTFKMRVGAVYNDSGSNFMRIKQLGMRAQYTVVASTNTAQLPNIANGTAGTYSTTSPTLAAAQVTGNGFVAPTTAGQIIVVGYNHWKNGSTASQLAAPADYGGTNNGPLGSGGQIWPMQFDTTTAPIALTCQWALESNSIYWASSAAGGAISCLGWVDNI